MSDKRTVTFIGSGNVVWHLSQGLAKAGHRIEAVYSRKKSNAQSLADLWPGCIATDQLDFSKSSSSLFIIAVNDQAIEELSEALAVPEQAIVAHTSGSVSIDVLSRFSKRGVFYPLQTFTKGKETALSDIPFGIEASEEKVYHELSALALSLTKNVQSITSDQRKIIHIAAVFACNFTNYFLSVSEKILIKENLSLELLSPLVNETIRKAFEIGPEKAQTGPAIRGDEKIIQQHLDYLQNEPELQELYRLISERIEKEIKKERSKK